MNTTELEKKIKQLVHSLAYEKGYVCPLDVLLRLQYLTPKDVDAWRFGRVPYLEKVCTTNLSKLTFINKTVYQHAVALQLTKSVTACQQYGKGPKRKLRFSKSGNPVIETAYASRNINRQRIAELKQPKPTPAENNAEEKKSG
jgi:hypothetical protein